MSTNQILGIPVKMLSRDQVLEQIRKYLASPAGIFHIVSLNPENLVLTTEDHAFKKTVATAQIKLVDGVGVVLAGRLLGVPLGSRLSGVDLVKELVEIADNMRLRVVLIGARDNLAIKLADCYGQSYKNAQFLGLSGFNDVHNPKKDEEKELSSIVADYMPQIVLVAFGSPVQELFIDRHSKLFKNCLCMGVGGAFDFLSGKIPRAPKILRQLGLEWLFRLIVQPWRWRRQLRLFKFVFLVIKQRLGYRFES